MRLRSAIPELHIAQGPCRATTAWLDEYFAGSARPFPFPDHLKQLVRSLAGPGRGLQDPAQDPAGRDPVLRGRRPRHRLHPRQIGWLVAANHLAILIPCHRVVGKDGSLVGYGGGLAKKRWLLDHELRTAGVVAALEPASDVG